MTSTSKDADGLIAEIPDLTIEVSHREDMVILQQTSGNADFGVDRIAIHATQVRLIAEHMGLLSMPEPTVPQLQRTIATLSRRLRVLHDRIDELDDYLHKFSDTEHADMEWEQNYSRASWTIANEFIVDMDETAGKPVGPESNLEPRLAPGVLWEGSNGGRQICPGSAVSSGKRQPEPVAPPSPTGSAAQLSLAVGESP